MSHRATLLVALAFVLVAQTPAVAQSPGAFPFQTQPEPPPPTVMSRRWAVSAGIGWESLTAKTEGGDKITFGMLDLTGRFRIRRNVEVALSLAVGGTKDDVSTAALYADLRYRFMAEKPWNVYGVLGLGVAGVGGKNADDDEKKGRGSLRLGFGVERRFTSLALFGEARAVWVAENKDIDNLSDQPDWYQYSKHPLGGGHVVFGATFYF
jgi:hypothetical protein